MRYNTQTILIDDGNRMELRCPFGDCDLADFCHVVDVKWEIDPDERDRKRVRLEVRCEGGHGFVLDIKNHAGTSYLQWEEVTNHKDPFERAA